MIDEKLMVLGGATALTISGLGIVAKKLQWQPIHLSDVVVRTIEVVAQGVKYTVYGIVGFAVLVGLFFVIRHALRTWKVRQLISITGWVVGAGLFFWGINTLIIPLIVAGILAIWVGALTALTIPEEDSEMGT